MPNFREIFHAIILNHKNDIKWDSGDYIGIKSLSNTKVGSVGQNFIEHICNALLIPFAFPVNKKQVRANQSPWDLKIDDVTFEIKTATEDTGGKFQFNHIRYHREYEAVLCLGVSPNDLYFNVWTKADVATGKAGKLVSMEKGGNASYKLTKGKNDLLHIESFDTTIRQFIIDFKK